MGSGNGLGGAGGPGGGLVIVAQVMAKPLHLFLNKKNSNKKFKVQKYLQKIGYHLTNHKTSLQSANL